MIISERGVVSALNKAYKSGGYTAYTTEGKIYLYSDNWYLHCEISKFPKKALARIVEHTGILLETAEPMLVCAAEEPQNVMLAVAESEIATWMRGEVSRTALMVPVIFREAQVYQESGSMVCYGVNPLTLSIVERGVAELGVAAVTDEARMMWSHDGEVIIIKAVRPATADWKSAWEREVWKTLETIDLHKKEN